MNDSQVDRPSKSSATATRAAINSACDRFEDAWLEGKNPPEIADFFDADVDDNAKSELLGQLLDLDLFYRSKHDMSPDWDRLHALFPAFAGLIREKIPVLEKPERHDKTLSTSKSMEDNRGSSENARTLNSLLHRANAGDDAALGSLLDQHRSYLRIIAEREIGGKLRNRVDPSDVVQKSCLAAIAGFKDFAGITSAEFIAWITALHRNKIKDEYRMAIAAKRDLNQESDLPDEIPDSAGETPQQRILNGESAVLLAQAMDRLPENQREVVRLRHLEGWSIQQLAVYLDSNPQAVAALIYRGVTKLKKVLGSAP